MDKEKSGPQGMSVEEALEVLRITVLAMKTEYGMIRPIKALAVVQEALGVIKSQ